MTPRVPILLYHQLLASAPSDREPADRWGVSAHRFRGDMTRLERAGWRCIRATEAATLNLSGRRAPRTFALTFDDAYRDFATRARPVLRELGFTATVFVVTGRIGGTADWPGGCREPLLDADELRELAGEGFDLGGHSHSHPRLPECSPAELSRELEGSREVLSELSGREVDSIAWPYGAHDGAVRLAAEAAGYRLGFAVAGDGPLTLRMQRAVRPSVRDPLAVPRREVHGSDSPLRRRLRMGPADGLFVTARKIAGFRGDA
jgi:peptidoglycan/xylan/chitin deacetylase (PgdA/CDA1 family)